VQLISQKGAPFMLSAIRYRLHLSQRDQGFTLVELVVAMMIMAVILFLLIGIQIQAATTIKDAKMRQQATALANESLEQMRAIPWLVLKRGMYSNFDAVSGNDPYVTGSTLTVAGQTFTLRVAPAGAGDQQLTPQAWPPLFDTTGSHKRVRPDPALTGTMFTVRSYVTTPLDNSPDAVGLAVVVTWQDTRGVTRETVVSAPSFAALACSTDPNRSPFAGACQARLTAGSSTGSVSSNIAAWNTDTNAPAGVPVIPGTDVYSFSVSTASVGATSVSEQTTFVTGSIRYGNAVARGNPNDTFPSENSNTLGHFDLGASNDPLVPGAPPKNPAPLDINPVANEEPFLVMNNGGSPELRGRSDFRRPGDALVSATVSCRTGIPAGQPCAYATLGNRTPDTNFEASSNFFLQFESDLIRLMRRLNESGGNTDAAWAGRFTSAAGTAAVGCTVLTGPGCVSAGAERNLGTIAFGTIFAATTWSGGNTDVVRVENYQDSVRVERGHNGTQKNSPAVVTRSGTLRYWNGSSMATLNITPDTNTTVSLGTGTWTSNNGNHSMELVGGQVQITPAERPAVSNPDANCITAECQVFASSGTIVVSMEIIIRTPSYPTGYAIMVTSVINPVSASAVYKDAPPA
jgi:prepilin-type N-terminal cleavage/methylation domain-containing protein